MSLKETLRTALAPLPLDGDELQQIATAVVGRPPVAIRVRPDLRQADFVPQGRTVPWHPDGRILDADARPGVGVAFAAGAYYIQDAGSLLAVTLLDPRPGERICDLCAAPGGKSTVLLTAIGDAGWLLANEPVRSRLGPLQLNLARQGATRFAVSQLDPDTLARRLGPVFDAVLVDAPCSGQSLLGRKKQSESALAAATVEHCAARQNRILRAAVRLVRPGGRLVYSTCTFSPAENESQIGRLLQGDEAWSVEADPRLAAWESPLLAGTYRLWPHRDPCAGAFAARLRCAPARDADPSGPASSASAGNRRRRSHPLAPASLPDSFAAWGAFLRVPEIGGNSLQCYAWPEPPWPPLSAVAFAGPEIAFRKGNTWFPAYALAMRRDRIWQPAASTSLDDPSARDFIRGMSVRGAARGWCVALWNDLPLGWVKGDGSTLKNHLPKAARLNA